MKDEDRHHRPRHGVRAACQEPCGSRATASRSWQPSAQAPSAGRPSPRPTAFPSATASRRSSPIRRSTRVLLLTPPNTHLDLVRRAAAAGKHVLLEKPLEISLERAEELVAVAEKAGIKLGIVLQHRFRPISIALGRPDPRRPARRHRQRFGAALQLAAAELLRPAGPRHQGARRRRRAADPGDPHARPADFFRRLPVEVTGLRRHQPGPPHGDGRPRHGARSDSPMAASARSAPRPRAYPGIPDAMDIIGTKGMARIEGAQPDRAFHDGTETDRRRRRARRRRRRRPHGLPASAPSRRDRGFPRRDRTGSRPRGHRPRGAEGASPDRSNPALVRDGRAREAVSTEAAA